MTQKLFYAIISTLLTIIFYYMGITLAMGELAAIGLFAMFGSIFMWGSFLSDVDERRISRKVHVNISLERKFDGDEPLDYFYMVVQVNGNKRYIPLTQDTYDELNAKL